MAMALMLTAFSVNIFANESDIILNDNTGIPDKYLYRAILRELGKKDNDKFTKKEAADIESLNAGTDSKNKIKSLKGLENLTGLTNLSVRGNDLKSIKEVEALINLKTLHAGHNKITTIPNLTKHTKLNAHHTLFQFNNIEAKEFKAKLPSHLLKNSSWLKNQKKFQNVNNVLKVTSPISIRKISRNTTKIVGKTHKGAIVGLFDIKAKRIKKVKANDKGIFVLNKLNLKKYGKKNIRLASYIYDSYYGEDVTIKSVYLTVK